MLKLQDVLCALCGFKSEIFIPSNKNDCLTLQLSDSLDNISYHDKSQMEPICIVGGYVRYIECFIENNKKKSHTSWYVKAFCSGIDEIMEQYYNELIYIENKFLKITPNYSYIATSVNKYHLLFVYLVNLIKNIEKKMVEKHDGCNLISLICENNHSGVEQLTESINCLLKHLLRVFLNQTIRWCLDQSFEQYSSGYFISNKENNCFVIDKNMVPEYFISHRLAEKIYYIGYSIGILNKRTTNNHHTNDTLKTFINNYYNELNNINTVLLLDNMSIFEKIIDKMSDKVTTEFWVKFLYDINIKQQLLMIKDIYFMARGELFLTFLDGLNSKNFKKSLKESNVSYEINNQFSISFDKIGSDSSSYIDTFYMDVKLNLSLKNIIDYNTFHISYHPPWPLVLVFDQNIVKKMNDIFIFLLTLKRAHIYLNKSWYLHLRSHSDGHDDCWMVYRQMLFIVNSLQYYIHIDVIEENFNNFLNSMLMTNELPKMNKLVNSFLDTISKECFQKNDQVRDILKGILEICIHAANNVPSKNTEEYFRIDHDTWNMLENEFIKRINLFIRILYSMSKESSFSSCASKLLTRIDFNYYYARKHFNTVTIDETSSIDISSDHIISSNIECNYNKSIELSTIDTIGSDKKNSYNVNYIIKETPMDFSGHSTQL